RWARARRQGEMRRCGGENREPETEQERHHNAHLTANTQIAPPSGTSGYWPGNTSFSCACMPAESTPQPDCTATYCLPSMANDVGWPMIPELVGNSHSSFPVVASNAWNFRSFVPPVNTRPPPVASIGPQFGDVGYLCVHARLPVSTFHAWTSPT